MKNAGFQHGKWGKAICRKETSSFWINGLYYLLLLFEQEEVQAASPAAKVVAAPNWKLQRWKKWYFTSKHGDIMGIWGQLSINDGV